MDVGERIKKRRTELGLTLEDVAESLGVAKSTVLRYETKDINNMGIDKIAILAKCLRTTPAYLMGWDKSLESQSTVEDKLLSFIGKLNDLGKKEAIKRVEELTQIPRYQMHYVMAAHNDAEMTDEEIELMKKDLDEL